MSSKGRYKGASTPFPLFSLIRSRMRPDASTHTVDSPVEPCSPLSQNYHCHTLSSGHRVNKEEDIAVNSLFNIEDQLNLDMTIDWEGSTSNAYGTNNKEQLS